MMRQQDLAPRRCTRRFALKGLGAATALGLTGALNSCAEQPESLAMVDDLDGAALEGSLRGELIPEFDELTLRLVDEWQSQRNASLDVEISLDWKAAALQIAERRQGADIVEVHNNQPHVLSDRLVDVSELAEWVGESMGGWTSVARDTCVVDGIWRAVPWSATRHCLVIRADALDAVSPAVPDSYEDLLEVAESLHDAGLPPVGLTMSDVGPSDSSALAYSMVWAFGGQELSENGRVAIDSAHTLAALTYFKDLSRVNADGALSWGHPDNNAAFLAGRISVTQNPSSIYVKALDEDVALAREMRHVPLPQGPAGRFQLPEINSLGIFRHSPDAEAASDFIEFVMRRSVLIDRAEKSLAFHAPLVIGLDDDPQMPWRTDLNLAGLSSGSAEGRMPGWPLPPSLEAGLVYQNASIVNMFNAVGSGLMTPREALATGAEELRRVYET